MTDDTSYRDADFIKEGNYLLGGLLSVEDVFVDGMSQFIFGFPISKIVLHAVVKPGSPEIRKAVIRVTMPTAILIEMCQKIMTNSIANKEQLLSTAKIIHPMALEALLSAPATVSDDSTKDL